MNKNKSIRQVRQVGIQTLLLVTGWLMMAMPMLALDVNVPAGGDIQAAINQVNGAGGGNVDLAAGTWTLTNSINMSSGVSLNGQGAATILQGPTNVYSWPLIRDTHNFNSNMIVQNLILDGRIPLSALDTNYQSNNPPVGPYSNALGITFTAAAGSEQQNVTFNNLEVRNTAFGVAPKGIVGLNISGCYIHDNGYYYWYHNVYVRRCNNVVITNTLSVASLMGDGLHDAGGGTNILVVDSIFDGNASDGINVQDTPVNITITNCDISYNVGEFGFTGANALVTQNDIDFNQAIGFHSYGGSGIVSYNNAFGNLDADYDIAGSFTSTGNLSVLPWSSQDVGSVGLAGSSSYTTNGLFGTFTVTGSGTDIGTTNDAFHYVYESASGSNCMIVAQVTSLQDTSPWAKAGVMIRETLASNSKHASIFLTPGNGISWQYRATTGGTTSWNKTAGLTAPYWVCVTRTGNTFSGYCSPDGVTWTLQGTTTITMANTFYIGLPVTADGNSVLCTATFESVSKQ